MGGLGKLLSKEKKDTSYRSGSNKKNVKSIRNKSKSKELKDSLYTSSNRGLMTARSKSPLKFTGLTSVKSMKGLKGV